MIGRKIVAVALGVAALMMLAGPASAGINCPPPMPRDACLQASAQATVPQWTHIRVTPKRIHFTVTATNTNTDTNAGAFDAQLVVTLQRGALDYYQGPPKTILAANVPDGGSFSATFSVAKIRGASGRVTAFIEDVLCDGANETVTLS